MNLKDYLAESPDISFENVQLDSRKVSPGSVFFALPGQKTDGARFVKDAIEKGAVAIVAEKGSDLQPDVPLIEVKDIHYTLAQLMNAIYRDPGKGLFCYGVTGTDGKTTTAQIIYQLLKPVERSSYMGTIGVETADSLHDVGATTPLAPDLYREVAQLRDQKITSLALEVSSHALAQHRAEFIKLDVGIITNVISEHLDFHGTLENYVSAKRSLVDLVKPDGIMLLNVDDQYFEGFQRHAHQQGKQVATYGIEHQADFRATNINIRATGISFNLVYQGKSYAVDIGMIGIFNVYNSLAAIAATVLAGHDIDQMIQHIRGINGIYGRSVFVNEGQDFQVLLDFAHTPNAIKLLLNYLRHACDKENRKMILVTGAAGDRDPGKRKPIGQMATHYADQVIFADEDPGREDPKAIMNDILQGVVKNNYAVIHDRKTAVIRALESAGKNDLVVLLAKAGMTYDVQGEEKIPYDEIAFVIEYLRSKRKK